MVKLSQAFKTKEVELKSLPWSKIVVKAWLSTQETREIRMKFPNISMENQVDADKASMAMVLVGIISRNLEDDNWKTLDINEENIGKLPMDDFWTLIEIITWVEVSKKK